MRGHLVELENLVEEFAYHVAAQTDVMAGDDPDARIGNRHARRSFAARPPEEASEAGGSMLCATDGPWRGDHERGVQATASRR